MNIAVCMSSGQAAKPPSQGHELFIGLVGSIGTDMKRISDIVLETLRDFAYNGDDIRLSHLLYGYRDYSALPKSPIDAYYEEHMNAGNDFRRRIDFGGALAVLAMMGIRTIRKTIAGEERNIMPRYAFVLNSLKHPSEVRVLRSIYGQRFILFSVYTPREMRLKNLAERIAESRQRLMIDEGRSAAEHLVQRDDVEFDKYGQNVRHTFPLGDFFVDAGELEELRRSIRRSLEVFFGHPFRTPTRDEYGMFLAFAAALRSADLSRQVGAVICTREGDVVAVGTNEVPKAGGGLSRWKRFQARYRRL
jgi:cytidine deaminase